MLAAGPHVMMSAASDGMAGRLLLPSDAASAQIHACAVAVALAVARVVATADRQAVAVLVLSRQPTEQECWLP